MCVYVKVCVPSSTEPGDIIDNDCDGKVDEEILNAYGGSSPLRIMLLCLVTLVLFRSVFFLSLFLSFFFRPDIAAPVDW